MFEKLKRFDAFMVETVDLHQARPTFHRHRL
jgi:hypothetical protein